MLLQQKFELVYDFGSCRLLHNAVLCTESYNQ